MVNSFYKNNKWDVSIKNPYDPGLHSNENIFKHKRAAIVLYWTYRVNAYLYESTEEFKDRNYSIINNVMNAITRSVDNPNHEPFFVEVFESQQKTAWLEGIKENQE